MRIVREVTPPPKRPRKPFQRIVQDPPIGACVAHRCDKHRDVRPINLNTPEQTECAACVGDDLVALLSLYNDVRNRLERACGALNLLSPGAGDAFQPPVIEETEEPKKEDAK